MLTDDPEEPGSNNGTAMTDRMEKLAALPPRTKAGKIRAFMPEIERRIAEGVSHRAIIQWLAEGGIEVTPPTFKSYLQRYRWDMQRNPQQAPTPPSQEQPLQNTDRSNGTDPEPITDGNPDRESTMPEPDTAIGTEPSLGDILDPRKRDANTDRYMVQKPTLIGKKRSESK